MKEVQYTGPGEFEKEEGSVGSAKGYPSWSSIPLPRCNDLAGLVGYRKFGN
jgi:hypothetical protein